MVDPGKLLSLRTLSLSEPSADVPNEEDQSFKTYLHWLQCVVRFCSHHMTTEMTLYVALSIGRTSAFLRRLLAYSRPSRTRLMCPRTRREGHHTIVMSCYYFPIRTRMPSSRSHPAHLSEMHSMYGSLCRNMHSGLTAEARLCGERSGIWRVRGSGERSLVSPHDYTLGRSRADLSSRKT